jgi:hypothetical protein
VYSGQFIFGVQPSFPLKSNAEVNVNVMIPLPGLAISAAPAMIVIPDLCVLSSNVGVDIFFITVLVSSYRGQWFISLDITARGVLSPSGKSSCFARILPYYRHVPPGCERIPYRTVREIGGHGSANNARTDMKKKGPARVMTRSMVVMDTAMEEAA